LNVQVNSNEQFLNCKLLLLFIILCKPKTIITASHFIGYYVAAGLVINWCGTVDGVLL